MRPAETWRDVCPHLKECASQHDCETKVALEGLPAAGTDQTLLHAVIGYADQWPNAPGSLCGATYELPPGTPVRVEELAVRPSYDGTGRPAHMSVTNGRLKHNVVYTYPRVLVRVLAGKRKGFRAWVTEADVTR